MKQLSLPSTVIGEGPAWARIDNVILRARNPLGILGAMRNFFLSPDATKSAYLIGLAERLSVWNAEKYTAENADALLDGLMLGGLVQDWGIQEAGQ